MKKAAVLGPKGTFSEFAVKEYKNKIDNNIEMIFCSTISKVVKAAEEECDIAIIPIENTLDGFVQVTLDLLSKTNLNIIYELVLPIQFAFAANSKMEEVQRVYAQFKTQGQCCEFLEKHDEFKIITTESNGQSLKKLKEGVLGEGAIVPAYAVKGTNKFKCNINNVTDSEGNETRFIVLSKEKVQYEGKGYYKTGIIISDANADKPGTLWRVLNEFSVRDINLTSIISRPTKKGLGQYYFFIEVDGCYFKDNRLNEAVEAIKHHSVVKVVGTYYKI
ncbi:prephenate dehydratase [Clostridium acetobutylicum]|uniref:Prephenate dehydratase n=1 Tax=Clostridium acetobutylicum (strain ATCC 824 / DSM 792 / JCM 1419 / IAM 19013 / LMG 5710 / NBRC 13948 / NRRL B-527 / VKM B-1787 / 2291 / W) TaxID=272562 RepID=Q97MI0_CLOAB|nr:MULTISPECIES: prephenate dehydratase [Clostridium]AAK78199.1 Prephenate dehydrotase (pheA) [Clostridium acetobutylicum ATCC 824]ADZ19263.1 Prephenate dehydrotase (pheA) [Clostridium acetobutylicum EA 2018]AEI33557.1 prephenate dehydrotase (pheA) [Clostridium acetobutylicum DSM 1731]AWV82006.1 ACT domain-containing protein [Clostridium acetobutylicum]MBC2395925.1 prephenate dehydratase [Clostridium acetobutylicum]